MRKSIFDKIKNASINYAEEMQRVEVIFAIESNADNYSSIQKYTDNNFFLQFPYRGTFTNICELRDELKISKKDILENDLETMLTYFEFVHNITLFFMDKAQNRIRPKYIKITAMFENIGRILSKLDYEIITQGDCYIIVEKDANTTAVAEVYPELAEKVVEYRRFNLKGNIERKREILNTLWLKFEAIRPMLKANNFGEIETKTGSLLNNLNIRHNGVEGKNAKDIVQQMDNEELEQWYDKTYDLLLISFMLNYYLSYKNDIEILNQALTKK